MREIMFGGGRKNRVMQTRQKVLARSCEVNLGQRPEILVIAIPPQTCHYYSRHHLLHGYLNLILC